MKLTKEELEAMERSAYEETRHAQNWNDARREAFADRIIEWHEEQMRKQEPVAWMIRHLQTENTELRKDAARYRWLRDEFGLQPIFNEGGQDDDLDAAIDAAMKGTAL